MLTIGDSSEIEEGFCSLHDSNNGTNFSQWAYKREFAVYMVRKMELIVPSGHIIKRNWLTMS